MDSSDFIDQAAIAAMAAILQNPERYKEAKEFADPETKVTIPESVSEMALDFAINLEKRRHERKKRGE